MKSSFIEKILYPDPDRKANKKKVEAKMAFDDSFEEAQNPKLNLAKKFIKNSTVGLLALSTILTMGKFLLYIGVEHNSDSLETKTPIIEDLYPEKNDDIVFDNTGNIIENPNNPQETIFASENLIKNLNSYFSKTEAKFNINKVLNIAVDEHSVKDVQLKPETNKGLKITIVAEDENNQKGYVSFFTDKYDNYEKFFKEFYLFNEAEKISAFNTYLDNLYFFTASKENDFQLQAKELINQKDAFVGLNYEFIEKNGEIKHCIPVYNLNDSHHTVYKIHQNDYMMSPYFSVEDAFLDFLNKKNTLFTVEENVISHCLNFDEILDILDKEQEKSITK